MKFECFRQPQKPQDGKNIKLCTYNIKLNRISFIDRNEPQNTTI